MLIAQKIAKKIAFLRSRSLNFAIAIIPRSFDQMAIADRDLDRKKNIGIAIDDRRYINDRRSLMPCSIDNNHKFSYAAL